MSNNITNDKLELFYDKPAKRWEETLPVGNGSLGAMLWGGVNEEFLGLNEESLWSGYKREKNNYAAYDSLARVRELVLEGKVYEASEVIRENMLGEYGESYMPLGNLRITYNMPDSKVMDYRRSLDIENSIATVDFSCNGVNYHREVFSSYPAKAVIIKLTADSRGMDLSISMESLLKCTYSAKENGLSFKGKCPEHLDPSYVRKGEAAVIWGYRGMRFSGSIQLLECDGQVKINDDAIEVSGASLLVMAVEAVKTASLSKSYDELKQEHIQDYRQIFNKTRIYLGEQKAVPTDMRLEALKRGDEDNGLFGLYFQYGRYLMISSSRQGSLPANLQGIWSWDFQAPWSCNWTTNINLEMNYWPALSCGLEECMEPYFSFVEKLAENGRETARINYHCRGTVLHHNADGWGCTNPMGIAYGEEAGREKSVSWSMWPMGMAWLSQEFYRYYEYTNDMEFLRNRAYPLLKETALFLVDWLVEHNGKYVTCPSTSPENLFYTEDGKRCAVTMASAMDMTLIEEVFRNYISICEKLNLKEDEVLAEVKERLAKLENVQIGSYGQILEWFKEYEEVEPGHRHISHLYGMFPSELWQGNEELTGACRVSLKHRLDNGGGYTGWSCAWLINMFAVLGDGEAAGRYLNILLNRSTYPNLWDAHEPFQIDGNFGGTAGIANMLVQDRGGEVKLLAALPKQFENGYAKGIRIKNKQAVDIEWENGKIVSYEIYSV